MSIASAKKKRKNRVGSCSRRTNISKKKCAGREAAYYADKRSVVHAINFVDVSITQSTPDEAIHLRRSKVSRSIEIVFGVEDLTKIRRYGTSIEGSVISIDFR